MKSISYIANFFKSISVKNFQTLYRAIKTESPKKIFKNFRKLLVDDKLGRVQRVGDLLFCCDFATFYKNNLLAGGWTGSINGIKQINIYDEANLLDSLYCEKLRPDIEQNYPQLKNAANSGFEFRKAWTQQLPSKLFFEIIQDDGQQHKFPIKILNIFELKDYFSSINFLPIEAYQILIELEKKDTSIKAKRQKKLASFQKKPKFSIVTNIDKTLSKNHFIELADSISRQMHANWEWIIVTNPNNNKIHEDWISLQTFINQEKTKIFSDLSNTENSINATILSKCTGEWIVQLKSNNILENNCFYWLLDALNNQTSNFFYTDSDCLNLNTQERNQPSFKSNFNDALLLTHNYIGPFLFANKKALLEKINNKKTTYYDFWLDFINDQEKIHHIPKVAYHQISPLIENEYLSKNILENYLHKNHTEATVEEGIVENTFRVKYKITSNKLVSIIIPFKDDIETLKKCINSILQKTKYPNFEIILISNNSSEETTFTYLDDLVIKYPFIKYFKYDVPFNYSKINNWAVEKASGEYILLLNNDIEVLSENWLNAMLEHIQQEKVGAVGAKLLYPDDTVQHAGIVVGIYGVAENAHKYVPKEEHGYENRVDLIQNLSACTAACLLIKKTVFKQVNGLDDVNFKVNFNDVDFCLKIRELGLNIVYTPYAQLYHYESKSRGKNFSTPEKQQREIEEIQYFKKKWAHFLKQSDPYYNPNLTHSKADFSINLDVF